MSSGAHFPGRSLPSSVRERAQQIRGEGASYGEIGRRLRISETSARRFVRHTVEQDAAERAPRRHRKWGSTQSSADENWRHFVLCVKTASATHEQGQLTGAELLEMIRRDLKEKRKPWHTVCKDMREFKDRKWQAVRIEVAAENPDKFQKLLNEMDISRARAYEIPEAEASSWKNHQDVRDYIVRGMKRKVDSRRTRGTLGQNTRLMTIDPDGTDEIEGVGSRSNLGKAVKEHTTELLTTALTNKKAVARLVEQDAPYIQQQINRHLNIMRNVVNRFGGAEGLVFLDEMSMVMNESKPNAWSLKGTPAVISKREQQDATTKVWAAMRWGEYEARTNVFMAILPPLPQRIKSIQPNLGTFLDGFKVACLRACDMWLPEDTGVNGLRGSFCFQVHNMGVSGERSQAGLHTSYSPVDGMDEWGGFEGGFKNSVLEGINATMAEFGFQTLDVIGRGGNNPEFASADSLSKHLVGSLNGEGEVVEKCWDKLLDAAAFDFGLWSHLRPHNIGWHRGDGPDDPNPVRGRLFGSGELLIPVQPAGSKWDPVPMSYNSAHRIAKDAFGGSTESDETLTVLYDAFAWPKRPFLYGGAGEKLDRGFSLVDILLTLYGSNETNQKQEHKDSGWYLRHQFYSRKVPRMEFDEVTGRPRQVFVANPLLDLQYRLDETSRSSDPENMESDESDTKLPWDAPWAQDGPGAAGGDLLARIVFRNLGLQFPLTVLEGPRRMVAVAQQIWKIVHWYNPFEVSDTDRESSRNPPDMYTEASRAISDTRPLLPMVYTRQEAKTLDSLSGKPRYVYVNNTGEDGNNTYHYDNYFNGDSWPWRLSERWNRMFGDNVRHTVYHSLDAQEVAGGRPRRNVMSTQERNNQAEARITAAESRRQKAPNRQGAEDRERKKKEAAEKKKREIAEQQRKRVVMDNAERLMHDGWNVDLEKTKEIEDLMEGNNEDDDDDDEGMTDVQAAREIGFSKGVVFAKNDRIEGGGRRNRLVVYKPTETVPEAGSGRDLVERTLQWKDIKVLKEAFPEQWAKLSSPPKEGTLPYVIKWAPEWSKESIVSDASSRSLMTSTGPRIKSDQTLLLPRLEPVKSQQREVGAGDKSMNVDKWMFWEFMRALPKSFVENRTLVMDRAPIHWVPDVSTVRAEEARGELHVHEVGYLGNYLRSVRGAGSGDALPPKLNDMIRETVQGERVGINNRRGRPALLFNPSYNPRFNAIEMAFNVIKHYAKKHAIRHARTRENLSIAINNASSVYLRPEAVRNFALCAGYGTKDVPVEIPEKWEDYHDQGQVRQCVGLRGMSWDALAKEHMPNQNRQDAISALKNANDGMDKEKPVPVGTVIRIPAPEGEKDRNVRVRNKYMRKSRGTDRQEPPR